MCDTRTDEGLRASYEGDPWGEVVTCEEYQPPRRHDAAAGIIIACALAVPFWMLALYGLYCLVRH